MEQNKKRMENWNKKIIVLIIFLSLFYFLYNFDNLLCGSLSSDNQNKINSVHDKYGNLLFVEVIPCEFGYINIKLKHNRFHDTIFHQVHSLLYDSLSKKGWATLLIFDNKGNYLYSHSSNNKFYKQKGD